MISKKKLTGREFLIMLKISKEALSNNVDITLYLLILENTKLFKNELIITAEKYNGSLIEFSSLYAKYPTINS